MKVLCSEILPQTLDLERFRRGTSIVASVVNFVRPTTVASLSHRAFIFVHNSVGERDITRRTGSSAI